MNAPSAGFGKPMMQRLHVIRRALVVPLGIDTVLLAALLAISLLGQGDRAESWILALFTLPTAYLFLECLLRRVVVTGEGLLVRTLWKRKRVPWEEITHVGCLSLPRKRYLLLTTTRGKANVGAAASAGAVAGTSARATPAAITASPRRTSCALFMRVLLDAGKG